jgi:transcriptional regulator with XRE-family HTH domain
MSSADLAALGKRIRELRLDRQMTLDDLSQALRAQGLAAGHSVQHLSQVERGMSWPSLPLVNGLDRVLRTGHELLSRLRTAKVPAFPEAVADHIGLRAHLFYPLHVAPVPEPAESTTEVHLDLVPRLGRTPNGTTHSTLHSFPFGVVVLHEVHELSVSSLATVASWREEVLQRCPTAVLEFFEQIGVKPEVKDHQPYCFTAFVFHAVPWEEHEDRQRATQLIAMPKILLANPDPEAWTEQLLHSVRPVEDVIDHSLVGSHIGGASWASVSLMLDGNTIDLELSLIDFEAQLQAFWCYASNTAAREDFVASGYDALFMRRALARLLRPLPTESTAFRRLREAILTTSRIENLVSCALEATQQEV